MAGTRRIWWEKTVEYLFVSHFYNLTNGFVAPLDGGQERAGDAIFSLSNQWLLVEFKKDRNCLYREREKYRNFDEAAYALHGSDGHHLLVYGFEKADGSLGFTSITYFSQIVLTSEAEIVESGCTSHEFWTYIEKLGRFKKPFGNQNESSSSSDGLKASDYSMVMGVNNDQATGCMTVAEFAQAYQRSIERSGHDRSRTIELPAPTIPPPPPQKTIERGGGRGSR